MMEKQYDFNDFRQIISQLRSENGCPWDREQTHVSLKQCMIEEAYEVVDGIDQYEETGSDENLCEELGDVLLQVVMHCQIAEEEGRFTINDVIDGISKKMVHRHPHVFGDTKVDNADEVLQNWEAIKQEEKKEAFVSDGMKRIPKALPALIRASKVQKKAAKAGFDFESYEQVKDKVFEELQELEDARKKGKEREIKEEFGDLLFSVVNLSRFLKLNAENSLTNATYKFINRFVEVEKLAFSEGQQLNKMSIDELNALWGRIK